MLESLFNKVVTLVKGCQHKCTISAPPPFCLSAEGQLLVPNFEKGGGAGGQKKMSAWGVLKTFCHKNLPGGGGSLLCFL